MQHGQVPVVASDDGKRLTQWNKRLREEHDLIPLDVEPEYGRGPLSSPELP
jgi:hypothetical protein